MAAKEKNPKDSKVTDLRRKFEEERKARVRLAAEFDNYRKRIAKLEEDTAGHAVKRLLEKLFPVFDNFYRASAHAPEISLEDIPNLTEDDFKRLANYFTGLKMIEKQMEAVLNEAGLVKIKTAGAKFDPNLHEAVSYEASSEVPAEYVIGEIEAGWLIDGKVVKPAKVRVSKG